MRWLKATHLIAKYVLGEGTEHWRSTFQLDVGPFTDSIFTKTLENGGAHWFDNDYIEKNKYMYPTDLITVVGKIPSFTYAIEIDGRKVAILCGPLDVGR